MKKKLSVRHSRGEAAATVKAFEASGLTRRQFAARAGLSVWTLDAWRARQKAASRLVEVQVTPADRVGGAALTLLLGNGWRIEVGEGFAEETLERLLAVAEGR